MNAFELYQDIRECGRIRAEYEPVLVQVSEDGGKVYRIVHNDFVMYVRINADGSTTWVS